MANLHSSGTTNDLIASQRYCRRYARGRRENFVVASCLLPRTIRQHFYNLYTYCRSADDFADETDSSSESLRKLDAWQQQLDLCYQGCATGIAFVALQHTIQTFSIPRCPFIDLLTAFRRDQYQHRYANLDGLLDYCRYSANPVGHLVLYLAESFNQPCVGLSDDLCTGLQLINHCQDVSEDFQRGRIYLPQDAMQRYGVDESMLACSRTPEPLARLLSEVIDVAEQYLDQGSRLADRVPHWLRVDLGLITGGGRAAIHQLRRCGYDVLATRCQVSKVTQLNLLARAMCQKWMAR